MKKAVVLVVCFTFLVAGLSSPAEAYSKKCVVVSVTGDMKIIRPGETEPRPLKKLMSLKGGTDIITGKDGVVVLSYNRKKTNLVKVKENSRLMLNFKGDYKIALARGALFFVLREEKRKKFFRVYAPNGICTVEGTTLHVVHNEKTGKTILTATEETPASLIE